MNEDQYQPVEDSFRDGTVEQQDSKTLGRFLLALANQPIENDRVKHRDIIRGLTINHILLQRHIASLDTKNTRLALLVVALTIASVIGTASQTWYGYKADRRAEAESSAIAEKQRVQAQQQEDLSPSAPQASRQASSTPATNDGAYPKKSIEIHPNSSQPSHRQQ